MCHVLLQVAWLPVQLLLAGLQCVLQLAVLLAAVLQLLQQAAVLLPQGLTLPAALLQLGRPPGHSLPQLLVLLLLVCVRRRASIVLACWRVGVRLSATERVFTSGPDVQLLLQLLVLPPQESNLFGQLTLLLVAVDEDVGGC